MKAKEIISQLREKFNELVTNAETPQPPSEPAPMGKEVKLQDGTIITITEMTIGGSVMKDGIPMTAGTYTLEDGTALIVGDNGVIIDMKPAAPSSPSEDEMSEKYSKEWAANMQSKVEKFESDALNKFSSYENKFKEYEEKLNKAFKVIDGLLNLTQTLADTPTGEPDPVIKSNSIFKSEVNDMTYDILFTK